jgi:hypothetical protein
MPFKPLHWCRRYFNRIIRDNGNTGFSCNFCGKIYNENVSHMERHLLVRVLGLKTYFYEI